MWCLGRGVVTVLGHPCLAGSSAALSLTPFLLQNFCSRAALEALGSCLNNKYSEGYPGKR